jgi:hypothetical protein
MSLFAVALTLLKLTGINGPIVLIPLMYPALHMFLHVRGAYQLSIFSALWRTAALAALACVASLLFFLFLLMSGLLG